MAGAIDGIISGFNTSEMIETILTYERNKITLVEARQAEATNKLTTWKSIEALMVGIKSSASLMADKNLWHAKSASSSNEDIISISTNKETTPGTYFLTVDKLATHHQTASRGISSLTESFGSGTFEIQVGNGATTSISIDNSNNTLNSLKNAINNSDAGVTATVINDGTEHNQYRLLLTADDSGAASEITVTSNLSGETVPVFSAGFDFPEKLSWSDNATANPVLTTGATYTGNENKTYTFTVGGAGDQTIGAGDIEVEWTDGTNSGTITVSTADTDIALTGDGSDGLSLKFSVGDLVAGDTFQVQTFAPTIQQGQDSQVRLGSSEGGGSPIVFTSNDNTITDLIEGVTLNLNSLGDGEQVELKIGEDRSQIKSQIKSFVDKYNEYQKFVDAQFSFDEETGKSGVLLGETSLIILHNDLRSTITNSLTGLPDDMRRLGQAGITFNSSGQLTFSESDFDDAIEEDFTKLMNLFKSHGATDHVGIEYIASTGSTRISTSGYDVNITQAATRGSFSGVSINNPADTPITLNSSNNSIKLRINNITSDDIQLTEKTYNSGEELAQEIEDKINSDTNVSGIGVTVEWIDSGSGGSFAIKSNTYGGASTVVFDVEPGNSAHSILGLKDGISEDGLNVEGTINGEKATGVGQYLTGNSSNDNTADLKLLITLTEDDLGDGAEGSIFFNKGIADVLNSKLTNYTDPYNGALKARKDSIESSLENYADRISVFEEQLGVRRIALHKQFQEMESALAQLQAEQQYLTAAISNLDQLRIGNN